MAVTALQCKLAAACEHQQQVQLAHWAEAGLHLAHRAVASEVPERTEPGVETWAGPGLPCRAVAWQRLEEMEVDLSGRAAEAGVLEGLQDAQPQAAAVAEGGSVAGGLRWPHRGRVGWSVEARC